QPKSTLFPYTTLFRSKTRSARIRTLSGGFGGRLLSQEHTPKEEVRSQKSEVRSQKSEGKFGNFALPFCLLASGFWLLFQWTYRRSEEHTSELQSLRHL